MLITSRYDESIVYDTENETICGSKIKSRWLSDGENLYVDTDSNYNKLSWSRNGYGVTPYKLYETDDGRFYDTNGARWDGLYSWNWGEEPPMYYYDKWGDIKTREVK